jgi:hypothetical protein
MGPMTDSRWRRSAGLLGLALAALLPAPPARAEAAAAVGPASADGVSYLNKRVFLIPYATEGGDRRVQKVILHVSEDKGRRYFESGSTANPSGQFKFTTDHDGEYWFAVQTVDVQGKYHPETLELVQPGLKVFVDTAPPVITLGPAPARDGAAVEWTLSDDRGSGVDLRTLKLEYLPPGGREFLPVNDVQPSVLGSYRWTSAPLRVRLSVKDRCGNLAEKEIALTSGAGPSGPGPGPGAGTLPDAPAGVVMVKNKTFNLTYDTENEGSSGVKAVEIYYFFVGPDGKDGDWMTLTKDAPPKGPYTVNVEKEGRYGFTLIARNGSDLSDPPPKRGDRPQMWVEVDEKPPEVKITSLEMGKGLSYGRLTIRWTATDPHLAARPIKVYYGPSPPDPDGKSWKLLAEGLSNSDRNAGFYVWDIQGFKEKLPPGRVLIKVEAVDQAGNVGSDVSKESVPTDLTIPRVRSVKVETTSASTTPPAPAGLGAVPVP